MHILWQGTTHKLTCWQCKKIRLYVEECQAVGFISHSQCCLNKDNNPNWGIKYANEWFFYKFHKIFNIWTVQVTFLDRNGLPDTGANINLMSDSFGNLQITSSPKIANGVHLCIKGIVTVDVNANDVKWLIDDIKKVIISRQLTKDLNLLWSHNKHSITIFSWILAFVCLCIWN